MLGKMSGTQIWDRPASGTGYMWLRSKCNEKVVGYTNPKKCQNNRRITKRFRKHQKNCHITHITILTNLVNLALSLGQKITVPGRTIPRKIAWGNSTKFTPLDIPTNIPTRNPRKFL